MSRTALLAARWAPPLPVRGMGRGASPRSGTGGTSASSTRARYRSSSAWVCAVARHMFVRGTWESRLLIAVLCGSAADFMAAVDVSSVKVCPCSSAELRRLLSQQDVRQDMNNFYFGGDHMADTAVNRQACWSGSQGSGSAHAQPFRTRKKRNCISCVAVGR